MHFSASLRLRPVRIAFLVNPRDFATVRRCMRLCTCLWGGVYNPIIPIFGRSPKRWHRGHWRPKASDIGRGYIRFFEPDVVVEAEAGLASKVGWEPGERYHGITRLVELDKFISKDVSDRINFASGLDITAVHAHRYHKEFKYQHKREEKFAIMERAPKADAFFDAFVGVFPENANLAYIEANYKEAFQPTALALSVETFLTRMQEHHYTPQWFTREGLEEDFSGHSEFKFFILDPADAQDLIDLWNLRQFERNVIPIHIDWFDRCAPMMCDLITRNFRPLPGNPHGVMIRSTIEFARSIANEHAQRLVEAHIRNVPRDSWGFQLWYEPIWESRDDRMVFRPQRVRLSA